LGGYWAIRRGEGSEKVPTRGELRRFNIKDGESNVLSGKRGAQEELRGEKRATPWEQRKLFQGGGGKNIRRKKHGEESNVQGISSRGKKKKITNLLGPSLRFGEGGGFEVKNMRKKRKGGGVKTWQKVPVKEGKISVIDRKDRTI